MNAFLPVCAAFLVIFTTAFVSAQPLTKNGHPVDDKMYEHFLKETDVDHMLDEALSWNDAVKQQEHFEFLKEIAASKDNPKQKFAQKILDRAQERFDNLLEEIQFPEKVSVERYIQSLYEMQTKNMVSDTKILQVLHSIADYKEKKKAEDDQAEQGEDVQSAQQYQAKQDDLDEQQAAAPGAIEAQNEQTGATSQSQTSQEEIKEVASAEEE